MVKQQQAKRDRIKTKCCGTITRCSGPCLLGFGFGGATKCVTCGWLWNEMPGVEASPMTVKENREAHS